MKNQVVSSLRLAGFKKRSSVQFATEQAMRERVSWHSLFGKAGLGQNRIR